MKFSINKCKRMTVGKLLLYVHSEGFFSITVIQDVLETLIVVRQFRSDKKTREAGGGSH